eukprot:SAG31_NODE_1045_length_10180_cov_5.454221_5_plen_103_part_00
MVICRDLAGGSGQATVQPAGGNGYSLALLSHIPPLASAAGVRLCCLGRPVSSADLGSVLGLARAICVGLHETKIGGPVDKLVDWLEKQVAARDRIGHKNRQL